MNISDFHEKKIPAETYFLVIRHNKTDHLLPMCYFNRDEDMLPGNNVVEFPISEDRTRPMAFMEDSFYHFNFAQGSSLLEIPFFFATGVRKIISKRPATRNDADVINLKAMSASVKGLSMIELGEYEPFSLPLFKRLHLEYLHTHRHYLAMDLSYKEHETKNLHYMHTLYLLTCSDLSDDILDYLTSQLPWPFSIKSIPWSVEPYLRPHPVENFHSIRPRLPLSRYLFDLLLSRNYLCKHLDVLTLVCSAFMKYIPYSSLNSRPNHLTVAEAILKERSFAREPSNAEVRFLKTLLATNAISLNKVSTWVFFSKSVSLQRAIAELCIVDDFFNSKPKPETELHWTDATTMSSSALSSYTWRDVCYQIKNGVDPWRLFLILVLGRKWVFLRRLFNEYPGFQKSGFFSRLLFCKDSLLDHTLGFFLHKELSPKFESTFNYGEEVSLKTDVQIPPPDILLREFKKIPYDWASDYLLSTSPLAKSLTVQLETPNPHALISLGVLKGKTLPLVVFRNSRTYRGHRFKYSCYAPSPVCMHAPMFYFDIPKYIDVYDASMVEKASSFDKSSFVYSNTPVLRTIAPIDSYPITYTGISDFIAKYGEEGVSQLFHTPYLHSMIFYAGIINNDVGLVDLVISLYQSHLTRIGSILSERETFRNQSLVCSQKLNNVHLASSLAEFYTWKLPQNTFRVLAKLIKTMPPTDSTTNPIDALAHARNTISRFNSANHELLFSDIRDACDMFYVSLCRAFADKNANYSFLTDSIIYQRNHVLAETFAALMYFIEKDDVKNLEALLALISQAPVRFYNSLMLAAIVQKSYRCGACILKYARKDKCSCGVPYTEPLKNIFPQEFALDDPKLYALRLKTKMPVADNAIAKKPIAAIINIALCCFLPKTLSWALRCKRHLLTSETVRMLIVVYMLLDVVYHWLSNPMALEKILKIDRAARKELKTIIAVFEVLVQFLKDATPDNFIPILSISVQKPIDLLPSCKQVDIKKLCVLYNTLLDYHKN